MQGLTLTCIATTHHAQSLNVYSYIDMQTYSYVASYMLTTIRVRLVMCIAIATFSHDVCVKQGLTVLNLKICRLLVSYITACI